MEVLYIYPTIYGSLIYILPYMEVLYIYYHIWKSYIYILPYMEVLYISYHIWKPYIYSTAMITEILLKVALNTIAHTIYILNTHL